MGRPRSPYSATPARYVGTKDAAAILGVSVTTVQKMVAQGDLPAWKTAGGHRRIDVAELRKLAGRIAQPEAGGAAEPGAAAPAARSTAASPLRVLLVEDNPVAVRPMVKVLERHRERVACTVTGDAAQALLQIAEQAPDLLVTDLVMQPFDGFHLLRVLAGSPRLAGLRIVVVTALTDAEIAERGGLPLPALVWRKPLHPERLAGYLDALLGAPS